MEQASEPVDLARVPILVDAIVLEFLPWDRAELSLQGFSRLPLLLGLYFYICRVADRQNSNWGSATFKAILRIFGDMRSVYSYADLMKLAAFLPEDGLVHDLCK